MTIRVKICGINDPAGFDAAVQGGADWIGFVFFPASPRYVTPARAAELSARSPGGSPHAGPSNAGPPEAGPLRVGLFVDPTEQAIEAALREIRLDVLQLYGAPEKLPALRSRFGLPVWRAKGVAAAADLPADTGGADAWLLEAKPPADATRPGGNAVSFDWTILRGWHAPGPWLLAGGLRPDNVAEAIRVTGAGAVDVSSGVECAKGVKDPDLVRAFIRNARTA